MRRFQLLGVEKYVGYTAAAGREWFQVTYAFVQAVISNSAAGSHTIGYCE